MKFIKVTRRHNDMPDQVQRISEPNSKRQSATRMICLAFALTFLSDAHASSCVARTEQALKRDVQANRVVIGVAISGAERVRGIIDFKIDFAINSSGEVTYAKLKETNAPDKEAVGRIESTFKKIIFDKADCENQEVSDFLVSVYL